MTIEELNARIEKKEKDIQKIEKRIAKWTSGMNDEAKQIVANCELVYDDPKYKEAYATFKNYKNSHDSNDTTVWNDDWNKGPNLDEAYSAYRDLAEAKATLAKYQTQLAAKNNFNNMDKIPAIWDFLQKWKVQAREFFIKNAEEFGKLRENHEQAKKDFLANNETYQELLQDPYKNTWRARYAIERQFDEDYYENIHSVTRSLYTYKGKLDEEKLDKFLEREVESKYKNLVARITEKAGDIQDASGLYIAANGEINGIVVGSKNVVRVETIMAGGYNVDRIVNTNHGQILHYRVLVYPMK